MDAAHFDFWSGFGSIRNIQMAESFRSPFMSEAKEVLHLSEATLIRFAFGFFKGNLIRNIFTLREQTMPNLSFFPSTFVFQNMKHSFRETKTFFSLNFFLVSQSNVHTCEICMTLFTPCVTMSRLRLWPGSVLCYNQRYGI